MITLHIVKIMVIDMVWSDYEIFTSRSAYETWLRKQEFDDDGFLIVKGTSYYFAPMRYYTKDAYDLEDVNKGRV